MSALFFEKRLYKGMTKLGDIVLPGDGTLPAFSETPFLRYTGPLLDSLPQQDKEGMRFLLVLISFLPNFCIRGLLALTEKAEIAPKPFDSILRQLRIGLKGICFSLYYGKADGKNGEGEKILRELSCLSKVQRPAIEATANIPLVYANAKSVEKTLRKLPLDEKLKCILRLKQAILKHKEEIIEQVQKETKKTQTDILMSEIFGVLDHLDYLLSESKNNLKQKKAKTPFLMMGKSSYISLEPLGTVLVISPWNYPFYQAIVPITTSFLCGNATIYKPSEFTPLEGLVEALLVEAGFQDGWVQIVYGDGKVGAELVARGPSKVFFTGSVKTGKKIMAEAAQKLTPVELELGGKDPMIVFEDVNIDRAARGALWGALTASGQSCTSVERVYVQEKIYEPFLAKVLEHANQIKMGTDEGGGYDIGPMTTPPQIEIVADHLEDALSKGAILHTGKSWDRQNAAIPPLVLTGVNPSMKIVTEETFGPILPIMKFYDENEAIEFANDSIYGLSASVWSKDLKRAKRVASEIVTGNVSINNVMLTEGNHHLPFGGVKNSGFGRYKGQHGFHSFSNTKSILLDKDSGKVESNWYPFTKVKYQYFSNLVDNWYAGGLWKKAKGLVWGIRMESHSQKAKH